MTFIKPLLLSISLIPLAASAMYGSTLDTVYDAVGSIKEKSADSVHCSATLIAPDIILMAEHCRYSGSDDEGPYQLKPKQTEFVIGSDSSKAVMKVGLKKWMHAGTYSGTEDGHPSDVTIDVLFAQLEKPITKIKDKVLNPIPLVITPDFTPRIGKSYEIVGYGISDRDSYQGKRQKGSYVVTTTSGNAFLNLFKSKENFLSYIEKNHPGEEEILDRHFVRGTITQGYQVHAWDSRGRENLNLVKRPKSGWTNSCNGDSGGPLLQIENGTIKVVGIISAGYNGETDGCVRIGSLISIMGPKTMEMIKKNKIPVL